MNFTLVRMRGLEPPRCHHHRLLRPARLPVPPHPQGTGCHYANGFRRCQPAKELCEEGALLKDLVAAVPVVVVPPIMGSPLVVPVRMAPAMPRPTARALRTATIPTTVACVMTINKLATLLVVVTESTLTMATTAALAQCRRRNTQPQQHHQGCRPNQFSYSQ